jgi:hypothetical protein
MKQTAVEWYENEIDALFEKYDDKEISKSEFMIMKHNLFYPAKEMEKEQACDFADYVINRAKDFEDGLIDHREYEGSIDEMFERRYRDGGAELSTEEKQYWEDVDKLRKEREEKYK